MNDRKALVNCIKYLKVLIYYTEKFRLSLLCEMTGGNTL